MRILLVGEYSRLHNSLKEALVQLGHEVNIVGNGDGFKHFPVDFNIDAKFSKSWFPNIFRQIVYRIFKYDFAELEYGIRFYFYLPKLKNYDVVQLISETPVQTSLAFEYFLLKKLGSRNGKMFALSSGVDACFVKSVLDKKFRYSLFAPYLNDKSTIEEYRGFLKQSSKKFQAHHRKMAQLLTGIIATDIDYAISMHGRANYLGMIPNPVNLDKFPFRAPETSGKIVIFLGINKWNYHKKGIIFFEKALETIQTDYGEKVKVVVADSIPYNEYIQLYDQAHILLDQVYAYDQGYNALEAMAKGKVVFTGAEKEFADHYRLTARVAINALPDAKKIAEELSFLIENPGEIATIGTRAGQFVKKEHDYLMIGRKYLEKWNVNPKSASTAVS